MRSSIAVAGLGLVALIFGSNCDWQDQTQCHRDLIERFACCPTCEADCRAAISEACAEIHDTPLKDADEQSDSSDSSGGNDESGDGPLPHPR